MPKVEARLKRIHCLDPQDPIRDELYFVSAFGSKESDSKSATKTIRGVKRGYNEKMNHLLIEGECNINDPAPIIVTLWEQRAMRDGGKIAKALEKIATQAIDFAKDFLDGKSGSGSDVTSLVISAGAQVGGYILDNIVSWSKRMFKDSVLGEKIIAFPVQTDEKGNCKTGTFNYQIKAKSTKRPTYDYVIDIDVIVKD